MQYHFHGEQAGIVTNGEYGKAKIVTVIKENVLKYLNEDNIVVVAGFQGVDRFGNITTLGRGGSDLSAVAIASAFKADECQIYTDVDGVYSADPRIVSKAKLLKHISYDEMLEAATCGAKVLHNRSVGVARLYNIPMVVKNVLQDSRGTTVTNDVEDLDDVDGEGNQEVIEHYGAKIITKTDNVSKISIVGNSLISCPDQLNSIFKLALENDIQIMLVSFSELCINLVVKKEVSEKFVNLLHDKLIGNEE